MTHFLIKTFLSALVIAGVSELGKKSPPFAAIVAALPLTSIMTVIWLYSDTKDIGKVSELSTNIAWAIVPSFIFLLSLPFFLRNGVRFSASMGLACTLMLVGYGAYAWVLRRFGVQF